MRERRTYGPPRNPAAGTARATAVRRRPRSRAAMRGLLRRRGWLGERGSSCPGAVLAASFVGPCSEGVVVRHVEPAERLDREAAVPVREHLVPLVGRGVRERDVSARGDLAREDASA